MLYVLTMAINAKLQIEYLQKELLITRHKLEDSEREKIFFQTSLERANTAIALLRTSMGSANWELFENDLKLTLNNLTSDIGKILGVFKALGIVVGSQESPETVTETGSEVIEESEQLEEPTEQELEFLEADMNDSVNSLIEKRELWDNNPHKNPKNNLKSYLFDN